MAKEMPHCGKCGKQHWFFQNCSEGKTIVARNYGMIRRPHGYQSTYGGVRQETTYLRQQPRANPKISYQGDDPEAA